MSTITDSKDNDLYDSSEKTANRIAKDYKLVIQLRKNLFDNFYRLALAGDPRATVETQSEGYISLQTSIGIEISRVTVEGGYTYRCTDVDKLTKLLLNTKTNA